MQFTLIRHGQADAARSHDPYSPRLTELGHQQAARVAEQCAGWGIQFLCASTMQRAQETSDAISEAMPRLLRWDLQELEDLTLEDLDLDPTASHLASTWTPAQLDYAFKRGWVRIMAALARIQIYAAANGIERVAIVAHGSTLTLLLLNWLGADWSARHRLTLDTANGATCRVDVAADGAITIGWLNRLP